MNMQAMMKQAQKIQKEMQTEKKAIDEKRFVAENDVVRIEMMGNRNLVELEMKLSEVPEEDKEMVEDMILVAFNQVMKEIEDETEQRLGKYTQGMSGMF